MFTIAGGIILAVIILANLESIIGLLAMCVAAAMVLIPVGLLVAVIAESSREVSTEVNAQGLLVLFAILAFVLYLIWYNRRH